MRSMKLVLALLATSLVGTVGCADRTYLTKSHGRAYSEAFGRQAVEPQPRSEGEADRTQGLDSQEAAVVAGSYRRSLAGKEGGDAANQHQMVLMNPAAAAPAAGYMPPPSVPGN